MSVFKGLVSAVVGVQLLASGWAGTVVCSNLTDDGADVLCDANGLPLPLGCYAAIGHFGSLSSAEIEQRVSGKGILGLMEVWKSFGETFAVGRGSAHAGCFEVELREVLGGGTTGDLHVLVTNGPSPEASTSLILLAFEGTTAPSETAGGLSETRFLHLRDASVVIGTNDEDSAGVRALAAGSTGYATWIHDQLGSTEPALLGMHADSDGDGACNLAEYALLGDLKSAADEVSPDFVISEDTGELEGRFPARMDDPRLAYEVEVCGDLVGELWEPFVGDLEINEEDSLPDGFHECRVPVPDVTRHFLRVRVSYGQASNGGS